MPRPSSSPGGPSLGMPRGGGEGEMGGGLQLDRSVFAFPLNLQWGAWRFLATVKDA